MLYKEKTKQKCINQSNSKLKKVFIKKSEKKIIVPIEVIVQARVDIHYLCPSVLLSVSSWVMHPVERVKYVEYSFFVCVCVCVCVLLATQAVGVDGSWS
jgi:hypothetical protein